MEFTPILAGLPVLALHIATAAAIFCAAITGYVFATPHAEWQLVRGGNPAAGISLAGAILGIGLPLQACVTTSLHVRELLVMGGITVAVQIVLFIAMARLIPDLSGRIERGEIAVAAPLAAAEVVAGLLLHGAMQA